MSNVITEWRQAVMAHLEQNLQSPAFEGNVVGGERDGLWRAGSRACVFEPTDSFNADTNPAFARPQLIVRAWVPKPKVAPKSAPPDPAPLEQLKIDLAVCLKSIQNPSLPAAVWGLYAFCVRVRTDYEDWGVEATLQAWTGNPAVAPVG